MNKDWKKEAPKLAAIENKNPFTVPEEYFNTSRNQLNSRLFIENLHPGEKFTVPDGYFDTLPSHIEGRIFAEKLKEEIIGNNFTVPEGYFSTLQNRINERVAEPVKVISLRSRKTLAWVSYAAAACITVAVSTALYFNAPLNTINSPAATVNAATASYEVSKVSDQGIIEYLLFTGTRNDLQVLKKYAGENAISTAIDPDISTEGAQRYFNNL